MSIKNSKICIVTTRNIFDAPCIDKYKNLINEPFDIIYWDRCNITENCGAANYFKYNCPLDTDCRKAKKLYAYIGFWHFVNKKLSENTYSRLIVFPTQMGWLIQTKLCCKYRKNYVLDIRDYAGEHNPIIYTMTKRIIKHCGVCSITSPAYKEFLPNYKRYIISHNLQKMDERLLKEYRLRRRQKNQPIVLSFIGTVRFIEQQKKIISIFKNDIRFQLQFIGRGSEQLENFCRSEKVENVTLIGRFKREELSKFYMGTDMAINIYGNDDPYLDYALSNKLYSAALMGMPILVSPKTYMAELVAKYEFGVAFDIDSHNAKDEVAKYFYSLDREKLLAGCDSFLNEVYKDEERCTKILKKYLHV